MISYKQSIRKIAFITMLIFVIFNLVSNHIGIIGDRRVLIGALLAVVMFVNSLYPFGICAKLLMWDELKLPEDLIKKKWMIPRDGIVFSAIAAWGIPKLWYFPVAWLAVFLLFYAMAYKKIK